MEDLRGTMSAEVKPIDRQSYVRDDGGLMYSFQHWHPPSFCIVATLFALCIHASPVIAAECDIRPQPIPNSASSPACIGWDGAWVMYEYSLKDDKWSSWKSPAIAALPLRGAYTKVNGLQGVVVDPLKNYEGWRFDFDQRQWQEIPKSPLDGATQGSKLYYSPVVVAPVANELFIWGDNRAPNHGAIFNFSKSNWTNIAQAPIVERYAALASIIGNKMVVLGGIGAKQKQTDGAVFDLTKGKWETMPAVPIPLTYGMVATQWRGRFVAAGGRANLQVAAYDLETKRWTVSPDAPLVVGEHPACVAVGDRLLIWSGRSPDKKLRVDGLLYDFQTKKWDTVTDAPIEGRLCTFAASVDEQAVVWGGWQSTPERFMRSGAVFDTRSRKWRPMQDIPGDVPMQLHPGW